MKMELSSKQSYALFKENRKKLTLLHAIERNKVMEGQKLFTTYDSESIIDDTDTLINLYSKSDDRSDDECPSLDDTCPLTEAFC